MADKKVYLTRYFYYFDPQTNRVARKYDGVTERLLTSFDVIYRSLKQPALIIEERPHQENPKIIIPTVTVDTKVDDQVVFHRQELGDRVLFTHLSKDKDYISMTTDEIDDLKDLVKVKYKDEPEIIGQLWTILEGNSQKMATIYEEQTTLYYELDYDKIKEDLDKMFGQDKDKIVDITRNDATNMKGFIVKLIVALYNNEPTHKDIIGYMKEGTEKPTCNDKKCKVTKPKKKG